jgi:hypothetical protein
MGDRIELCILVFFAAHSAEYARGMSILDGRRLGRTKDWCARQGIGLGLDLHINWERVAVQGGERIPNSLIASGSLPDIRGKSLPLRPGEFRLFHQLYGPFHNKPCAFLIFAFPSWQHCLGILAGVFFFIGARRPTSRSLSLASPFLNPRSAPRHEARNVQGKTSL